MQIDPYGLDERSVYQLLIGSVVPRPIAWVASTNASGQPNLAPFSYFNIACSNPPILLFCPQRRPDGTAKDTLRNVKATGECVIHIVSEALVDAMNQTSASVPYGTSEFDYAGLPAAPSVRVAPPRIAAAPVAYECTVDQIVSLGSADVVLCRVQLIHVRDDVYEHGSISLDALKPVARLAGIEYARVTDTFALPRPQ